eukprot:9500131-Pyramimonas_sp.AAC.1
MSILLTTASKDARLKVWRERRENKSDAKVKWYETRIQPPSLKSLTITFANAHTSPRMLPLGTLPCSGEMVHCRSRRHCTERVGHDMINVILRTSNFSSCIRSSCFSR